MKKVACGLARVIAWFTVRATGLVFAGSALNAAAQGSVNVYNWSDYIADDTISNFQSRTGISVSYDVYDSNEVLETRMLAGRSGYDLVVPTARPFADRHVRAGLYQPLDKSLLDNYGNLDPVILQSLADIDPGNQYLLPYMWGTTGIGYNVDKVKEILGDDMPLDTWRLVFDPEIVSRLSACGVSLMDDATEVFVAARAYRGLPTDDYSSAAAQEAADVVAAARPYIRYFHSSSYISDLANGDLCVAHGYSGDVLQARDRANEADNGVNIAYAAPAEGAVVWTDVFAIPVDAPNVANAHAFLNYIMEPEVIAGVSNYVAYANANSASVSLVDDVVRNDPGIYPPAATQERFIVLQTPSDSQIRSMNRLWTRVKTGR
ncbi:extracellular solute-binding protein [Pseudohongiella sp.]|uniref:Putrescine-binding periplasmic protein n=1 Tax=marine sediment metagenome TaxID=412755 RepID=A0A0F9WIN8_9ZZZZ|nr:extracellular solute-binding protein [Pseudohongiella sp.]HDZ07541.1 extracellular solute-binding protein [Pseudohongiella sp.]HEA62954.1 extracellular solute-binding protein [Pseudohongiella sp.]